MPAVPHIERHFTAGDVVRDLVIGMSDGLTVPFALAAGLSGAVTSSHIVITAGAAEIAAGSIAMGLGGYLAARSDAEHYASERLREMREIVEVPDVERAEVADVFRSFGLGPDEAALVVDRLSERPEQWVDFMMRFELGLEEPAQGRALRSAATIGVAYIIGGIVPLSPYFFQSNAARALIWSVVVTAIALGIFGALKASATGAPVLRSAMQIMLTGGLAATAAFLLAKAVS